MGYKKRKGQTLIHNLVENWMQDAGEIPNGDRIVEHLLHMEDDEFDTYMRDEQYTKRQTLMDEVIEKQKEFEEKHPNTRKRSTSKKWSQKKDNTESDFQLT